MDILIERADGVLTIALNRPDKKNAITAAMYQEMADAFFEAEKDASVRVVLLRGNGGIVQRGQRSRRLHEGAVRWIATRPCSSSCVASAPRRSRVVAAVAGAAVGVGTTMLLHCDLVYAASTAKFSMPFVQLGLCPEAASSLLLPRIAGYQRAAEKLLLGEAFDANEAMNMGFVNRMRRRGGGRCIGACAGEETGGAARFVAAHEQIADERRRRPLRLPNASTRKRATSARC